MHDKRTLRERVAGQSAMAAVVLAQESAPRRGRLARILGVSPLTLEARAHYRGALGELLVGDVLENLGPTWDVLHDLPLDGTLDGTLDGALDGALDGMLVDHLLIGRAGIFAVRAANYGRNDVHVDHSTVTVGGEQRDDVVRAAAGAAEVARLLSSAANEIVQVRPLLVIVDPRKLTIRATSSGVRVISSRELERVLAAAPHTLTGEQVAHVSDLADLEGTWSAPNAQATTQHLDTQRLHRDFGTIRTSVNDSLARRIVWASAAIVAVYATVCSLVATLVTVVVGS